ncbi:hypothetical protein LZ198_06205 [Myxococcus sp. K15C18031901]|uniref:hypothetical protein n=1 Tax=Myxococcus dinghuensis TaxID=2906761 RepID=UPI0020A7A5C5|nr:hypothetical protein [Myxococcus dinghuensis]MCP3098468.1 hypothetical protein [Myxococcus dinghuensis]
MFDTCGGCERRGGAGEIFDWCANCELSRCPRCMTRGCCDSVPAESGRDAPLLLPDPPSEDDAVELPEHFGGRCCVHARAVACSCAFHWVCERHGDQHIGTHD